MKEEANLDILFVTHFLTQHLWEEHEVIVVDPNQVTILNVLRDGPGKDAIGLNVGIPGRFVEGDLTGMVVEERPQNRVFNWSTVFLRTRCLPTYLRNHCSDDQQAHRR